MDEFVEKAGVLIEALPYIKKFRGKTVVIKYGGAAMSDKVIHENVLRDLVFMNYVGIKPILIHGGGPMISENLKKQGVQPKFINGIRVTDKETIKVVIDTLAEVNKSIVHDLNAYGARAIGLSGHHADILNVRMHDDSSVGLVGQVTSVNTTPMLELTTSNIIPVIYPIGIDSADEAYNINADEAAAEVAVAMDVQKIMLLTNVKGLLRNPDDDSSLISSVHVDELQNLIEEKVIVGGMIPKVSACIRALKGGVRKAHIIDGRINHSLLLEIFTDKGIGTEIMM